MGLKLHEDWGTTPAAIDCCLTVADEADVQVAIDTDTLNGDRVSSRTPSPPSRAGRSTPITRRGAGGGHALDIIRVCGEANVLPSADANVHAVPRSAAEEPPARDAR